MKEGMDTLDMIPKMKKNVVGLLDFLTEEVSKVGEVLSTETFVVYKNFNLKVPYVL